MALTCSAAWADGTDVFPVKGKTYTINRNGNANSYIHEKGNLLHAAPSTNTQKQYWTFVPTDKPNCYYIQNVTSKKYMQSTHVGENTQVKTGNDPVEYKVMKGENGAPANYYYMCSTDQTVSNAQDGTLGLNYQESTGKVVAYHIRYNRGNSYWDIKETEYDYISPTVNEPTPLAKRLGIYSLPCGSTGTAYLKACHVTGEGVTDELHYAAKQKPADYFVLVRKDSIGVEPGKTFKLEYDAAGIDEHHAVSVYFDWNADGVFETQHDFYAEAAGAQKFTVPAETKTGKIRMRVRLTDNELEGAEEDVHGQIYDFMMYVTPKKVEGIDDVTLAGKAERQTPPYNLEGKRIKIENHKGVYIQNGRKFIK